MRVRWKIVIGFLLGAVLMLPWIGLCNMIGVDASLIRPSPVWAKMIIGGVIGIPVFLLLWRKASKKEGNL